MFSKRALLSVSDKSGLDVFAKKLSELGYEIVSTGGTLKFLKDSGIKAVSISEITGFPEIMDGRVKTLHPKVHGGLLCVRDNKKHLEQLNDNDIGLIDIVAVNLYPFEKTAENPNNTLEEVIENIDIGGPAMIRSAAKNFKYVTVIVDPNDYGKVLEELESKSETTLETRKMLAVKVFSHTSRYDASIQKHLADKLMDEKRDVIFLDDGSPLRYGENSHQKSLFYKYGNFQEANLSDIEILSGKELSYNNYVDAEAALEIVKDYCGEPCVSIIKHTNPCGFASGETILKAFNMAWQGDIISAFGSVIAFSRTVDLDTANEMSGKFIEVVIAPDYDKSALELLKGKSKNLRILKAKGDLRARDSKKCFKHIVGGVLVQDRDVDLWQGFNSATLKHIPDNKMELAKFAWIASKHTKSNAIVLCSEYESGKFMVVGMGAGQPNRIDSLRKLAATKAKENFARFYDDNKGIRENFESFDSYIQHSFANCVLASDAFFPFADTIDVCSELGIKFIVQPGGSVRDNEVVEACNKSGISMVFTGMRHFRH